jgi:hypothetical protein
MATYFSDRFVEPASAIPLLDASSLPAAEDWALLESINPHDAGDFEPDLDRFGRFRLTAAFDE